MNENSSSDGIEKYQTQISGNSADIGLDSTPLTLEDVCPSLDKGWWRYGHLLRLNFHLAGSVCTLVAGGFDGTMMNNLQTLPSWKSYFNNPTGAALGTLNVWLSVAAPFGFVFCILFAEYLGRKKIVILGNFILIFGALLQGLAKNIPMFIAGRFFIGLGGISVYGAAPLLSETAYPTQRSQLTSFLAASFPLGSFTAALVTWGPYNTSMKYNNWAWRLPSILQIIYPIFSIIAVYFGPESPRWLIANGKEEEATKILVKYHGGGDAESPLVKFELSEIKAAIALEKSVQNPPWKEFFRTKANRHRLAIICSLPIMQQFCGNALISYYLTLILDNIGFTKTTDQLKINLGLTAYGLVWAYGVSTVCGRFKRTRLLMTSYGSMCFFFTIWIILQALNQKKDFKDKSLGIAIIAMIYLYQGCYHISTPIAVTYATEVLPFNLRGRGFIIYQMCGTMAGYFNTYANPIAMAAIEWKYYIVWCVWLLVQVCIVYFFFPETWGHALEEIAMVFGDEVCEIRNAGTEAVTDHKPTVDHIEVAVPQKV